MSNGKATLKQQLQMKNHNLRLNRIIFFVLLFLFGCKTVEQVKVKTIEYVTDSVFIEKEVKVQLPSDTVVISSPIYITDTLYRDVVNSVNMDTVYNNSEYIGAMGWVNSGVFGCEAYFLNETLEYDFKEYIKYGKKVETIIEKETKYKTNYKWVFTALLIGLALGLLAKLL